MTVMGELAGVTIVTPDLDRSVAAYASALGYRPIKDETVVGPALAAAWECPQAAGCRIRHLYPESGERRFLRFVESPTPSGYQPMRSYGWNAVELVVQDLGALHARLAEHPDFEVIGPPRVLDFDFTDQISAMQVLGPSGEVLYLTEIRAEIPGFELPKAASFVGCAFVAVLGSASIDEAATWYASQMGRSAMPPFLVRVEVLSAAHGMDEQHRHRLTTIALPERCLIELDDFPVASTAPRAISACGLPLAISMASFFLSSSEQAPDAVAGLRIGQAGEWVELLAPRD